MLFSPTTHRKRDERGRLIPGAVPVEVRFWEKVQKFDASCWAWQAGEDGRGYGIFAVGGTNRKAHRAAYELVVGPIPDGFDLDHLCRNPICVNPAHLEPVTRLENVRRGLQGRLKTHCKHGHEFTPDNVYVRPNGSPTCRVCIRLRKRRYRSLGKA